MCGDVAALQLARGQGGVDIRIGVEVDDFDIAQSGFCKQGFLGGNVPLAVTQPRLDAHFNVARFRSHRNVFGKSVAGEQCDHWQGCACLEDVAA